MIKVQRLERRIQESQRKTSGLSLEASKRHSSSINRVMADLACKTSIKTCLCLIKSAVLRTKIRCPHQDPLTSTASKCPVVTIWSLWAARFITTNPLTQSQSTTSFPSMVPSCVVIRTSSTALDRTQSKLLTCLIIAQRTQHCKAWLQTHTNKRKTHSSNKMLRTHKPTTNSRSAC